jgi:phosphoribosylglycinamide formyltransferase-1
VDAGVDSGPIILQRIVPVDFADTEGTLSARILAEEHVAIVQAVGMLTRGRLTIEGQRVRVAGGGLP